MALTQAHRIQLHDIMKDKIGPTGAELLLEALPPMDTATLATKTDVDNVRIELRGEMSTGFASLQVHLAEMHGQMMAGFAELRGDLTTEIANVDSKITNVDSKSTSKFTELDSKFTGKFAELDSKITENRGAIVNLEAKLVSSSRHIIGTTIAAAVTIVLTFRFPELLG